MSILTNPKSLYFSRLAQLLIAIGFLIVICDAGVHRGWWNNINGALAVGVISSIFTTILTIYHLISHHRSTNPFTGGSRTRTLLRLSLETILFLLWVASVVLMLRGKGGCPVTESGDGITVCPDGRQKKDVPNVQWFVGVAFGFVEIVSFIVTGLLVFKEDRETKVTGGTSYA
ncbi:hypothetical protein P7C71_g1458, partial [Lecanoromycetidae sp. Uapishka_2]